MRKCVMALIAVLVLCGVAFADWAADYKAWQGMEVKAKYAQDASFDALTVISNPQQMQTLLADMQSAFDMGETAAAYHLVRGYSCLANLHIVGSPDGMTKAYAALQANWPKYEAAITAGFAKAGTPGRSGEAWCFPYRAGILDSYARNPLSDVTVMASEVAWIKTKAPLLALGSWSSFLCLPFDQRVDLARFVAEGCPDQADLLVKALPVLVKGKAAGKITAAELKVLLGNIVDASWTRAKTDADLDDAAKAKLKDAVGSIKSVQMELL